MHPNPPATLAPRRPTLTLVATAVALALLAAVVPMVVAARPAAAAGITHADFAGRGYGHGRGMSQYGAQGYATKYGWSADQILNHYYGGTRAGAVTDAGGVTIDPNFVRVRLIGLDNQPGTLVGTSAGSTLSITGAGASTLPPEAKAVRMLRSGDHWNIDYAASCAGPWTVLGASTGATVTIGRASGSDELFTCNPDGSRSHYAGSIRAHIAAAGTRTINITTIEEYLRGVVPNESPATWTPAALQAQAVAARSYAMAGDTRHQPYADTCDTTLCQVYKGRYFQSSPTATKVASTHPNTDAAISATAGVVRVFTSSGNIARTEFSSTSGGWTAGGTFPAVEDLGDSISPVHTWSVPNVSLAPLAAKGTGNLTQVFVTKRNGLGADGGRVLEVRLDFDGQSEPVYLTGNQVRSLLRLRSDWFTISVEGCAGTDIGEFIDEAYQLFLGRGASTDEQIRWCDTVVRRGRKALTDALSVSDEWAGVQVDDLYERVLDRGPDPTGRAYWLNEIRHGAQIEDIAPGFYGSAEYFTNVGSTNGRYVTALYGDILGRQPDSAGHADWTRQLDLGQRSRRGVASLFYRSAESRRDRVIASYQTILGRQPDPGGLRTWSEKLLTIGEIELASFLASSTEYFNRITAD